MSCELPDSSTTPSAASNSDLFASIEACELRFAVRSCHLISPRLFRYFRSIDRSGGISLKIVLVGDSGTGKSSLLRAAMASSKFAFVCVEVFVSRCLCMCAWVRSRAPLVGNLRAHVDVCKQHTHPRAQTLLTPPGPALLAELHQHYRRGL